jgi:hypothetical protein
MKTTKIRSGLLGLMALTIAGAAWGQAPATPAAPTPTFAENLAAKAAQNRYPVALKDGALSGRGWEMLLEEGRKSRFFLVGEEHGIAEVPLVVRELFRALQPAGYSHLALEISPPMAQALDATVRGEDGVGKLAKFFTDNPPGVAFYTLQEEAGMLAAVRAVPGVATGTTPVLWGLDYEMMADHYLFDGVRRRAPEGVAKAAAEALYEKSGAAFAKVVKDHNPSAFFSFSNPPEIFAELRRAWPQPDPESARALDTIETTLAINQLFAAGRGWESNDLRARFNRGNFLRALNEAKAAGEKEPRVIFKFGANHMTRGRNMTEVFDLGNLAAEIAAAEGSQAYHLMVVGGAGTEHAIFNPMALTYEPAPVELAVEEAMKPLFDQALPEGWTLIDLRALRPLLSDARTTDPELMRMVHGYDGLLILSGSHASRPLP